MHKRIVGCVGLPRKATIAKRPCLISAVFSLKVRSSSPEVVKPKGSAAQHSLLTSCPIHTRFYANCVLAGLGRHLLVGRPIEVKRIH